MTDAELGRRFRKLVLDEGENPPYHNAIINSLQTKWLLLYKLIKEVQRGEL